ncbi:MAG TPA: YegP family protein [Flavobacterium sp.]|jgi:hypothetical protein
MPSPKFLIFRSAVADEYFYQLVSESGEVILSGEGYTKQNCLKAIAAVKKNAVYESRFDRWDGTISYSFNLKSATWTIIGRSADYTTAAARELAILEVKRDAPRALVIEMT